MNNVNMLLIFFLSQYFEKNLSFLTNFYSLLSIDLFKKINLNSQVSKFLKFK